MSDEHLDLFGNPWVDDPPRRGRPSHEVTERTRRRVSMLVAMGWSPARIAATIGVTPPTLRKHYFFELRQREVARDRLEARRLEVAWELAEAGNVGALREFGKLVERNDRMEAEREMSSRPPEPRATDAAGKKVMNRIRAVEADAELAAELELEATQNVGRH